MTRLLIPSQIFRSSSCNMSSKLPSVLSATEEDIQLLLAAQCHIGTKNCDKQMEPYVWKRRADGTGRRSSFLTEKPNNIHRYPRSQHRQDMGEARSRCTNHRCYRKPQRRLRDLCPPLRPPCGPQVRRQHWCPGHRRPLHPRFIHQLHHPFVQGAPPHHRYRPPC